jgi:hypothetical protein
MKPPSKQGSSGTALTTLVSIVGLVLIWAVVWANLPSKEEIWSGPSSPATAEPGPELDLTIPGVTARQADPSFKRAPHVGTESSGEEGDGSLDSRARQIAEVKCDAAVQQLCPDSLTEEDRQQCMAQRLTQVPRPCRHILRQRMVRWKQVEGYRAACADDLVRVCKGVGSGDGEVLVCLKAHEQDLSETCSRSLPKGHLLLRN